MGEPKREELKVASKRAVLVGLLSSQSARHDESALDELCGLAETADVKVVGRMIQNRDRMDAATCLGSGKLEELRLLMLACDAEIAIFDNDLSPSQGKNIEKILDRVVIDRSEVILDIFATHARTHEAKLQVELAQLLYMRPRLTRMWSHLERIVVGLGSARGPGEKQLELDRRLIDRRIAELRRRLKEVESRRERIVASRKEEPTVSLVGYTNAGKSTLTNALTGADVYVADKLFATLETRTRRWKLPNWGEVLLSDTVGFVRNLPHHLVASFKSTLEEARHAELLLHVVDASDPDACEQIEVVERVLTEIGADSAESLLVFNKCDAIEDESLTAVLRRRYPNGIAVSARSGEGLAQLGLAVAEKLGNGFLDADVSCHAGNGRVWSFLSRHAEILSTQYEDNLAHYTCRIPHRFANRLEQLDAKVEPVNGVNGIQVE